MEFENYILKIGVAGLTAGLVIYLPATLLARGIAGSIYAAVVANPTLNNNKLYCHEVSYGLVGSSQLNYEVVQYWYSDASHSKWVKTTRYYCSFM